MVTVKKTRKKVHEFFDGTMIVSFPGEKVKEWNFVLVKMINGSTTYEVLIDETQFMCKPERARVFSSILKDTVLLNLKNQTINYIE